MKLLKRIVGILFIFMLLVGICCSCGCNKADNIQYNISQKSDHFETYRKVTVINLRSDKILLEIEGYISIKDSTETELAIIVQTGPKEYYMHYVYTGSEIVYLVEQVESSHTDPYHHEVHIYAVLPDIEIG